MAKTKGVCKADVARDYIRRFPDAPTMTLTKKCYAENGALWTSLESCRDSFRYVRGAHGAEQRVKAAKAGRSETFREPQQPGDPFGKIPEGLRCFNHWEAEQIDGPCRVLVLADLHVPYHDREALVLALRHGQAEGCDTVLLLGDAFDVFALSRWEKDPRKRNFAAELETMRGVLGTIRELFPDARVYYKIGNHEERYESYMFAKAPELLGVADFELKSLLRCDDLGITVVTDKRLLRLGKLFALHGHEYRFSISNPVNPARGLFLRGRCSSLCGHFHQASQHSEKGMDDRVVSCWSVGCLCDMHPDYMPLNKWSHGFAVVAVHANGGFEVENYRIIDGELWR